ncbi:hypothetical protein N183_36295 [Sinorhizobium sp. Sb3]|nr:hypothetical protein N183_36295 [Sinorhizobium sp. Sb3]
MEAAENALVFIISGWKGSLNSLFSIGRSALLRFDPYQCVALTKLDRLIAIFEVESFHLCLPNSSKIGMRPNQAECFV